MVMRWLCVLLGFLLSGSVADAACSWVGTVGTAADATDTEVAACITDASGKTGAVTVNVPAGTPTWSTGITIDQSSGWTNVTSLTIAGAGSAATVITDGTGTGSSQVPIRGASLSKPLRLTALAITGGGDSFGQINVAGSSTIRIDHCDFTAYATRAVWFGGSGTAPSGVIDANAFHDPSGSSADAIMVEWDDSWTRNPIAGGSGAVFIENNTFTSPNTKTATYAADASRAAHMVVRWNTLINMYIAVHGTNSNSGTGVHTYEIYNNTLLDMAGIYRAIYLRGGTGVIFRNALTTSGSGTFSAPINLTDYRTCCGFGATCASPWDRCDGDSAYDGNVSDLGYPCYTQCGRAGTDGLTAAPLYEWANTKNGADIDFSVYNFTGCSGPAVTDHIQASRDFYNDTEKAGYTPYTCPHPLVGSGACAAETAGVPGYTVWESPPVLPTLLSIEGVSIEGVSR